MSMPMGPVPSMDDTRTALREIQAHIEQALAEYQQRGTPTPEADDAPLTIECDLSGLVTAVRFRPGSREQLPMNRLAEAFHAAAGRARTVLPPIPDGLSSHDRADAAAAQADAAVAWADDAIARANQSPVAAPPFGYQSNGRMGTSADGAVEVSYDGQRLTDVTIHNRSWLVLASDAEIEQHVIQASHAAFRQPSYGVVGVDC